MVINPNLAADSLTATLHSNQALLGNSLSRLSSGSKLTSPVDDPSGLAASSLIDSKVSQLNAAQTNVVNAVSFSQTQDGYLQNIASALGRMSDLSISAQDATKSDADRAADDAEFQTLKGYVTDTAAKDFNGVSLFSGTAITVTTDGDGGTFTMPGINLNAPPYSTVTAADVKTGPDAAAALAAVKAAINQISSDRATVGASQSRLEDSSNQLQAASDSLTAASSQITDVHVAAESTQYARDNIMVQSGTAVLAQANLEPKTVLQLLQ